MYRSVRPMARFLTSVLGERVMVQNMSSRREILPYAQCFNHSSIHDREKMEGHFRRRFSARRIPSADLLSHISPETPLLWSAHIPIRQPFVWSPSVRSRETALYKSVLKPMVEVYGTHVFITLSVWASYESNIQCHPQGSIEIWAWLAEQWSKTRTATLSKGSLKSNGQVRSSSSVLFKTQC